MPVAAWNLRATIYYTALEADYPAGNDSLFLDRHGTVLHRGSAAFFHAAEIEGSTTLSDGRTINVDGRVAGIRRWRVLDGGYGLDAVGCPLVPFRSAAVDPAIVPLGTKLMIARLAGMQLPDGSLHDGVWFAVDTGGSITGDRIDLFVGAGRASMAVIYDHGVAHLEALAATRMATVNGCSRVP